MLKKLASLIKTNYEYIVVILITIIFFVLLYGVKVLNPTYTDFLVGDYEIETGTFGGMDSTQHYFGWRAYRDADWQFPIGCYDTLSYPTKNSIIFTDSLPLFAVVFKLFSRFLPETFQYFGLWGFLCFLLQGVMAIRVIRHFTNDKIKLIISSLFFICIPMFLWRMYVHTALDSQWLLLMALEPLFAYKHEKFNYKKTLIYYFVLAFIAASVHIYILYFCGIILSSYCLSLFISKENIIKILSILFGYIGMAALVIALLGGFSVSNSGDAIGLDSCSMNLNSLFDSEGYSLFLPALSQYNNGDFFKSMQFEGYAYLGMGLIILLLVAIGSVFINRKVAIDNSININSLNGFRLSILYLMIISLLLALSPTVTFGDKELFKIPLPMFIHNIWSVFRSTGRVAWILVYVIVFIVIMRISSLFSNRIASLILILTLVIQMIDCYPLYNKIHSYFYGDISRIYTAEYQLRDNDFWKSVSNNKEIKHIIMGVTTYPYNDETWSSINGQFYVGINPQYFQNIRFILGDFAISNNMTFNYFLFARNKYEDARQYVFEKIYSRAPKDSQEYLYVFWEENKMQAFATGYNVYYADGLYIAYNGLLNASNLISVNDAYYKISFEKGNEVTYLAPNSGMMFACYELAAGEYFITLSSDDEIVPVVGSALGDFQYEIEKVNYKANNEYENIYKLNVKESDSTVCFTLMNYSEKTRGISEFKLSYQQ